MKFNSLQKNLGRGMNELRKFKNVGVRSQIKTGSNTVGSAIHDGALNMISSHGGKFKNTGLIILAGVSFVGRKANSADKFRQGLVRGLFPGSAYPAESGRFGTRTNNQPAGINGLRFNFRR